MLILEARCPAGAGQVSPRPEPTEHRSNKIQLQATQLVLEMYANDQPGSGHNVTYSDKFTADPRPVVHPVNDDMCS
jgi:hypothetical protein